MRHTDSLIQYRDLLKQRYEDIGVLGDDRGTAEDFQLRELEIRTAKAYMSDGMAVLDIGSGTGYALRSYAADFAIRGVGLDYAESLVKTAIARSAAPEYRQLKGATEYRHGSVTDMPFEANTFDVVTDSRCLMALLDWGLQKQAIAQVNRVLKPGGVFVMMEGTFQGLQRLNDMRQRFGLTPIDATGMNRLITLKFDEPALMEYGKSILEHVATHRFGMYYFISRVVHPLLVAPEPPRYDARINEIARMIAEQIPDYEGLGHESAFVWRKR
ncbi:MAG: class I SAM-dependent methyltransferase [Chloroflexi bacterium]|nr:class I SAM-dependent methyltransferase [Chloroflexota bacterium]